MQRKVWELLNHTPPPLPILREGILVLDATWNRRSWCLLLYRDVVSGKIVAFDFNISETYFAYLEDLDRLKQTGYQPHAIVSDGKAGLLKAVGEVYPEAVQQRCLIHIQRQALIWLTQNPKTLAGETLKRIVKQLLLVSTQDEATAWNQLLQDWYREFADFIAERTYAIDQNGNPTRKYWYTHKRLRSVWVYLRNAKPSLWFWLQDATIPRTTNLVEGGINSPLKRLLRRHTGLSLNRQKKAIEWWIFFTNNS